MPGQSPLRLIKRWRRYESRRDLRRKTIPSVTRGVYVLYHEQNKSISEKRNKKITHVVYIGVAGVAKEAKTGIGSRLRQHARGKKKWTHYSFFEVHDNISREEILELESFLLSIFRHDPRIELANKNKNSKRFSVLRQKSAWTHESSD